MGKNIQEFLNKTIANLSTAHNIICIIMYIIIAGSANEMKI
jgi:preprotein translocase subunit SecG